MKSAFAALIVVLTVAGSVPSLAQTRDDASPGVQRDERRATTSLVQSTPWQRIAMALGAPALRTLDEARSDAASHTAPQPRSVPFRPAMTSAEYAEAKAVANRAAAGQAMPPVKTDSFRTAPQTQPVAVWGYDGVDQTATGGWVPPDTHGAIGINYFVEVTNSHLDIFSRAGVPYGSVPLNGFFPYYTQAFFDPRVIYDAQHDRFIVIAPAFPESSTVQRVYIAASVSGNPTGSWYVSSLNVTGVAGDLFDYPQLGVHSQAAIITANIFGANGGFKYADVYAITLADLYSGNPNLQTTSFIGVASPSIAPPIVRDTTATAFLISAPSSGSNLKEYRLTNLGVPHGATLSGPFNVFVASYSVPPSASQPAPCSGNVLDTMDSRFVNASTQVGYFLYQVHTIAATTPYGTRPRPRYYVIYADNNALVEYGDFSASATSYDWNASIAATIGGDIYLGWSSTDPAAGINAQVVVSGKESGQSLSGPPSVAYTSSTCTTQSRWGDYSAVTFDPLPTGARAAWLVNETILDPYTWGTRIVQMAF